MAFSVSVAMISLILTSEVWRGTGTFTTPQQPSVPLEITLFRYPDGEDTERQEFEVKIAGTDLVFPRRVCTMAYRDSSKLSWEKICPRSEDGAVKASKGIGYCAPAGTCSEISIEEDGTTVESRLVGDDRRMSFRFDAYKGGLLTEHLDSTLIKD